MCLQRALLTELITEFSASHACVQTGGEEVHSTGGRKIMLPPLRFPTFPMREKLLLRESNRALCSVRTKMGSMLLCVRNPDKWCVRPENKLHMATDRMGPSRSSHGAPWEEEWNTATVGDMIFGHKRRGLQFKLNNI